MSKQATLEQKVTNHTNYQKQFPPKVCVDCGYIIIEEQHESYMTKCEHCLSKENE